MKGQIFKVISGFYDVFSQNKIYRVRGSGNLRNTKNNPLVGDFVEFQPKKMITKIFERKNCLIRPKVANIDQVVIVTSLEQPKFSSFLLNKFLAIIEHQKIRPIIIFTKKDLTKKSYLQEYLNQNYTAYEISNNDQNSLKKMQHLFENKLTVFTGQTGVGKSTTLSNIFNMKFHSQPVSKSSGRGKHTTRVVSVFQLNNSLLIDTPGFSSLDINLSENELSKSFHDFNYASKQCKFRDCKHDQEIICYVKNSVKTKKISKQRYDDYLKLLKEIRDE